VIEPDTSCISGVFASPSLIWNIPVKRSRVSRFLGPLGAGFWGFSNPAAKAFLGSWTGYALVRLLDNEYSYLRFLLELQILLFIHLLSAFLETLAAYLSPIGPILYDQICLSVLFHERGCPH
jgi:hypothetical protein